MKHKIWKEIPSLKGYYEASNIGQIRRSIPHHQSKKNHILSPQSDSRGYLRVYLSIEGKSFYGLVHRLVCEAFHGPSNRREVDHLNNNPSDNRPENLEWVTRSENNHRSRQRGYKQVWTQEMRDKVSKAQIKRAQTRPESIPRGEQSSSAKISETIARQILELLKDQTKSKASIAREIGTTYNIVCGIAYGYTWKHLPR